jgi:WD40 repeat protein
MIYSVEDAVAGIMSELSNIDVGQEPVAFCLLSPDGKVLLSCDDDGQLETWSIDKGKCWHG